MSRRPQPASFTASSVGKLILCGEHAVVYRRPAIALPVAGVCARVSVEAAPIGSGVVFEAPDLGRAWTLADAPDDPLSALAAGLLERLRVADPSLQIAIASDIPIASGMGSGAAIATALVRALAGFYGQHIPPDQVSTLVYESEKRFHGTPSGVDNTVVAYERPVWFERRAAADADSGASSTQPPLIEPIRIGAPFTLLIGDTGVRSATRLPVAEVRRRRQENQARYEALFDQVGALVAAARAALEVGALVELGRLLSNNHALLREIGVSCPELDALVAAALEAGALGAKLSGAGWGGVMVALTDRADTERVSAALHEAGAVRVLETHMASTEQGVAQPH
jgi:mevalonate kinase